MNSNGNQYQDLDITCRDCKTSFRFEAGEQAFFAERQFSTPTRCKPCRQARKTQQAQQTAVTATASPSGPGDAAGRSGGSYVSGGGEAAAQGERRPTSSKGRAGNTRRDRNYDD